MKEKEKSFLQLSKNKYVNKDRLYGQVAKEFGLKVADVKRIIEHQSMFYKSVMDASDINGEFNTFRLPYLGSFTEHCDKRIQDRVAFKKNNTERRQQAIERKIKESRIKHDEFIRNNPEYQTNKG